MAYVIGVDGGTESIRAGVFDLSGKPLAFASTPYKTNFPHPAWAEQNPQDWWNGLGQSIRKALAEARVRKEDVIGLSVIRPVVLLLRLMSRATRFVPH